MKEHFDEPRLRQAIASNEVKLPWGREKIQWKLGENRGAIHLRATAPVDRNFEAGGMGEEPGKIPPPAAARHQSESIAQERQWKRAPVSTTSRQEAN